MRSELVQLLASTRSEVFLLGKALRRCKSLNAGDLTGDRVPAWAARPISKLRASSILENQQRAVVLRSMFADHFDHTGVLLTDRGIQGFEPQLNRYFVGKIAALRVRLGERRDASVREPLFFTALQVFSAIWPEGLAWPEGVLRPDPVDILENAS